jgi:hypothetical protein
MPCQPEAEKSKLLNRRDFDLFPFVGSAGGRLVICQQTVDISAPGLLASFESVAASPRGSHLLPAPSPRFVRRVASWHGSWMVQRDPGGTNSVENEPVETTKGV